MARLRAPLGLGLYRLTRPRGRSRHDALGAAWPEKLGVSMKDASAHVL